MITEVTHDEQGHRVDVHRPSAINPGDYELAAPLEGLPWWKSGPYIDNGSVGASCDHCGHALRYYVRHVYTPTGQVVRFGEDCADLLGVSDNRASHEFEKLRRRAAEEKRQELAKLAKEEKRELFANEEPEVVKFLDHIDENEETFEFIVDMKRALDQWGSLTPRQVESVKKCIVAREQYIARKLDEAINEVVPEEALEEGKRVLEGEVLSHKWSEDTGYGSVHKMRVKLDDGNVVYGSVPRPVSDHCYHNGQNVTVELKGLRVRFTATVERSKNDENFGFFKRPTQAKVVV